MQCLSGEMGQQARGKQPACSVTWEQWARSPGEHLGAPAVPRSHPHWPDPCIQSSHEELWGFCSPQHRELRLQHCSYAALCPQQWQDASQLPTALPPGLMWSLEEPSLGPNKLHRNSVTPQVITPKLHA